MTNFVSEKSFERLEQHLRTGKMDMLKATVQALRLSEKPKESRVSEDIQEKTVVMER